MIELMEWVRKVTFPSRPWLVLGKGPTFSKRHEFDLDSYNLLALNHVVREQKVRIAHIIDIDVIEACADRLLDNCDWLLMPRRPHMGCEPSRVLLLEDFVNAIPILREMDARGRLVWYNLLSSSAMENSPIIRARYFSAEAALNILALMGVKTIRSLGIDGGRQYSAAFQDLKGTTLLGNGQPSFDRQFAEIEGIVREHALDYAPLVEPMRIFVGADESQIVAAKVLEYSIRKYASQPVQVTTMLNMRHPMPRDPANRPRTGFSFYRFLIPQLCGYRGRALYLDADMLVFGDIAELWDIPFGPHKVLCTYQAAVPDAWKGNSFFHSGRQMSAMILDCAQLNWDIHEIVRGLDSGIFDYRQLMFKLCVVHPDEIGDTLPPQWNSLENYEPEKTKLLHYTVVPTQPWKNDENPLGELWMSTFREAVEAGAISYHEISQGIAAQHLKPALAQEFSKAYRGDRQPAPVRTPRPLLGPESSSAARLQGLERELAATREQVAELQRELASLEQSWAWKIGRAVTRPVRGMRRALRVKG